MWIAIEHKDTQDVLNLDNFSFAHQKDSSVIIVFAGGTHTYNFNHAETALDFLGAFTAIRELSIDQTIKEKEFTISII